MAVIKERAGDKIFNIVNLFLLSILLLVILYPLIFILAHHFSDIRCLSAQARSTLFRKALILKDIGGISRCANYDRLWYIQLFTL